MLADATQVTVDLGILVALCTLGGFVISVIVSAGTWVYKRGKKDKERELKDAELSGLRKTVIDATNASANAGIAIGTTTSQFKDMAVQMSGLVSQVGHATRDIATLSDKVTGQYTSMRQKLETFEKDMGRRFDVVNSRFDAVEKRLQFLEREGHAFAPQSTIGPEDTTIPDAEPMGIR